IGVLRTLRTRRFVRPRRQTEQTADDTRHLRGESRSVAPNLASANIPTVGGGDSWTIASSSDSRLNRGPARDAPRRRRAAATGTARRKRRDTAQPIVRPRRSRPGRAANQTETATPLAASG